MTTVVNRKQRAVLPALPKLSASSVPSSVFFGTKARGRSLAQELPSDEDYPSELEDLVNDRDESRSPSPSPSPAAATRARSVSPSVDPDAPAAAGATAASASSASQSIVFRRDKKAADRANSKTESAASSQQRTVTVPRPTQTELDRKERAPPSQEVFAARGWADLGLDERLVRHLQGPMNKVCESASFFFVCIEQAGSCLVSAQNCVDVDVIAALSFDAAAAAFL
jgi:hypothetical protein